MEKQKEGRIITSRRETNRHIIVRKRVKERTDKEPQKVKKRNHGEKGRQI